MARRLRCLGLCPSLDSNVSSSRVSGVQSITQVSELVAEVAAASAPPRGPWPEQGSGPSHSDPLLGTSRRSGGLICSSSRRLTRLNTGGYMCAAIVALFCQWPLLTLVPYWCAQAAAETLVWYPQLSEQVRMPTLDSLRCTAVGDLPRGRVPRALRPTVGWPMDWPAGPLQFASVSTCALPAAVRASTFCLWGCS